MSHETTWRKTLDHFDAIKVGLTATPAQHTMAYFENLICGLVVMSREAVVNGRAVRR